VLTRQTEADLVQYASHQYPKHSAKVVRAAVHSIVKSTRGKDPNASASRLGTATAAAATPTASGSNSSTSDVLERDDLLQALAQVVALLGSLPPASSSSTSSSSLAGAA
jgi:hypothetical protein